MAKTFQATLVHHGCPMHFRVRRLGPVTVRAAGRPGQYLSQRPEQIAVGEGSMILVVLLCYKKGVPQKGQPESCRSRTRAMV